MTEQQTTRDPINHLIDCFWAILPEKTADEVATFKKDVLKGIKDSVDWLIETEIESTNQHVEQARRVRQEWQEQREEWEAKCAQQDGPAADAPPNPA